MMKKNLVFLLMAFLTLNFVACSDDDDNDPVTIEGRGFNIDQTFNVTNKDNTAEVIVNIATEKGIENLIAGIDRRCSKCSKPTERIRFGQSGFRGTSPNLDRIWFAIER